MAVTVKKAILWRREVSNEPGILADTLKPLVDAGVNLKVLMGYAIPGDKDTSVIEVYPITGSKAESAARSAGLSQSESIGCLQVEGDDEKGLGYRVGQALGDADLNISFVMVQVVGKKYTGFFGFETASEAERAISVIKAASTGARKTALRRPAAKKKAGARAASKKSTVRKAATRKTKAKAGAKKATGRKTTTKAGSAKKVTPLAGRKKKGARKAAQKKSTGAATTKRTLGKTAGARKTSGARKRGSSRRK